MDTAFQSMQNDLEKGHYGRMIATLEECLHKLEVSVFDAHSMIRHEKIPQLKNLYHKYEQLRQKCKIPENRPSYCIQVTTYNAPKDLERLCDSLSEELEYFAFPKDHVTLMIMDDSDNEADQQHNAQCAHRRWPFQCHYYGSQEQKDHIHTLLSKGYPLEVLLRCLHKSKEDFETSDLSRWGHKGVSGAMNMAFLLAKKHLKAGEWLISIDEDVSFDTFVFAQHPAGRYQRLHTYSYFHRLSHLLHHSVKQHPIDLILASSVGDYCTPKLAWNVIDEFLQCYGMAAPKDQPMILKAFATHFPTYDLQWLNHAYQHRPMNITHRQGDAQQGSLGIKGNNTSGDHMILSHRFLNRMPYCYHGPGRIADGRFFLLTQNDHAFHMAESTCLCLSHSKRSDDPHHDLLNEISIHTQDEYRYTGFNYALFYYLYTQHPSHMRWDHFESQDRQKQFCHDALASLEQKLPFPFPKQRESFLHYERVHNSLKMFYHTLPKTCVHKEDIRRICQTLQQVHAQLRHFYEHPDSLIKEGIQLFCDSVTIYRGWESLLSTEKTNCALKTS